MQPQADPLLHLPSADPAARQMGRAEILYAMVARDRSVVLAEYSALYFHGNFTTVARLLLEKLPPLPIQQKRSYAYDQFAFHYCFARSGGLVFLCLADKTLGRDGPHRFLEEVSEQWRGDATVETQQELLKTAMERVNAGDQVSQVRAQLATISDTMMDNIDKIIQRQEKIELLVEKSDALDRTAATFRREAQDLRRAFWWRTVRFRIFMLVTFVFLCALAIHYFY